MHHQLNQLSVEGNVAKKYELEFERVRDLIRDEGKAVISVFRDRDEFGNNNGSVIGYVHENKVPAKIMLLQNKTYTHRDILVALLHEYGHVLDYEQYSKCKRWGLMKEFGTYNDAAIYAAPQMPKYAKEALIKTEYLADVRALRLINKYNVCITPAAYVCEAIVGINIRKWELMRGKLLTKGRVRSWRARYRVVTPAFTNIVYKDLEPFSLL